MLSLSAENVALEVNSHPYTADHHEDVQVDFNSVMGCLSEGLLLSSLKECLVFSRFVFPRVSDLSELGDETPDAHGEGDRGRLRRG